MTNNGIYNSSIYLVPKNATEFLHTIERYGFAQAEMFNPEKHCNLHNMMDMPPQELVFCFIYLIGVCGMVASAVYIYWQGRKQQQREQRNGQPGHRQDTV